MEQEELLISIIRERDSRGATRCSQLLGSMEDVKRIQLFLRLFTDRAERKYMQELKGLLDESLGDWNYAMYVTLFRAAGGSKYKKSYVELARRVPYTAVAQEKSSPLMVEAMLLGASGLLDKQQEDRYTILLRTHFDYLARKHRITPMMAAEWESQRGAGGDMPYGLPVLRIAQLAGFLSMREFIFEGVPGTAEHYAVNYPSSIMGKSHAREIGRKERPGAPCICLTYIVGTYIMATYTHEGRG